MAFSEPAPTPSSQLQLPTGVPGLDEVLGGGIPEQSCTVITGGPGSGKTALALQFAFANASDEQPVVYFSGPGLPPERLERFHHHWKFFDAERVDRDVHFVNLGRHFEERDAARVIDRLELEISAYQAAFVVVDLPTALTPLRVWTDIALFLAASRTTSLLLADCTDVQPHVQGILAVADSVLCLEQSPRRTVSARKVAGQQPLPGEHTLQLTWQGVRVFPRWANPVRRMPHCSSERRISVLKVSDRARFAVLPYEIGPRGIQTLTLTRAREEYRPSNGHIVNYRYAG